MRKSGLLLGMLLAAGAAPAGEPPAFGWVEWADTIEEARERARKERRLVLALVVAWDDKGFEAGYEGAGRVAAQSGASPAELERRRPRDPGFVKEQAILSVLLGHPDLAALVARRTVPVRLRLHTWHFFDGGPGPFPDPLPALGTSNRKTRPPALLLATPDGELVHRIERMGVFDPCLVYRTLLAVLDAHLRYKASGLPPADEEPRAAVAALIAGGNFDRARKRLADAEGAWAALAAARMDALEGDLAAAEEALAALPPGAGRDALLGEVLVRLGRPAEAAALLAEADGAGRVPLAHALERLGRLDEARAVWERVAADGPPPLSAHARFHLAEDGPRPREWETLEETGAAPLLETTVTGAGDDAAAVRYLLAQQHPDGSWPDARGGPGDLSVPRTALCVSALLAWRDRVEDERLAGAIRRGRAVVARWSDAPRPQVWHLTYALHLELRLFREERTAEARRRIEGLLAQLRRIEHDGGWTYTAPPRRHTFNTAPILLLLVEARELGFAVDDARVERAVRFLEANRLGRTSLFHYGTRMEHMTPEKGEKGEKSSCLRSPLCELALHAAGAEKRTRKLARALDLFFEHQAAARATQKIFESYVDVTSLQDSYRYFFGTWYAARAVRALPRSKRKRLARELAATVRACQELDGSYVDSQMTGKAGATALALLALAELRE